MRNRGLLLSSVAALLLLLTGLFLGLRPKADKPTHIIPMPSEVLALTYSPDGRFLAVGQQVVVHGQDTRGYWAYATGKVQIRDIHSNAATEYPFVKDAHGLSGITYGPVSSLTYSPDGRWLLADSHIGNVGVMETATGRWIFSVQPQLSGRRCMSVGFTADSREAVYAEVTKDRSVKYKDNAAAWKRAKHVTTLIFRRADTGEILKRTTNVLAPGEWPTQFRLLSAPNLIAIATMLGDDSETFGFPAKIVLLDAGTGTRVTSVPLKSEATSQFSSDTRINTLASSAGGGYVAIVSSGGHLAVWNTRVRQSVAFPVPDDKLLWSVAVSPDGKELAGSTTDGTVFVWSIQDATVVRSLETHVKWIMSMAFSPDGKMLATAGEDHAIRLWAVK